MPLGGEGQRNAAELGGPALEPRRLSSGDGDLLALACPVGELLRQLRMPLARSLGHRALCCDPLFRRTAKVKTLVRFHYPGPPSIPTALVHNLPVTSYRLVNIHRRAESSARCPVERRACGTQVTAAAIQLNDETERLTARWYRN